MPKQQALPIMSLALNQCNDTAASGMSDLRTGTDYQSGGLNQGDYFDLTEAEANRNSFTGTGGGTLHAGRYRRIKVDSGATAANIKTGTIGLLAVPGSPLNMNVVTSYDIGDIGVRPVVFLNVITPGNYGFVQELGVATVLGAATIQKASPAKGDFVDSATGGLVNDLTAQAIAKTSLGVAMDVPVANGKFKVLLNLPTVQD